MDALRVEKEFSDTSKNTYSCNWQIQMFRRGRYQGFDSCRVVTGPVYKVTIDTTTYALRGKTLLEEGSWIQSQAMTNLGQCGTLWRGMSWRQPKHKLTQTVVSSLFLISEQRQHSSHQQFHTDVVWPHVLINKKGYRERKHMAAMLVFLRHAKLILLSIWCTIKPNVMFDASIYCIWILSNVVLVVEGKYEWLITGVCASTMRVNQRKWWKRFPSSIFTVSGSRPNWFSD